MATDLELQLNDERRLAVAPQPSPAELIRAVIDKGLTAEGVSVIERLVALQEHINDKDAEKQFAVAFAALQGELGTFNATREVPDKHGGVRYSYLPFDEIMSRVQPLLVKHGFSLSFSTDMRESRIVQTCTLTHAAGHHRDYLAFVRAGAGPYGATETQADGAAMTYAKRYALCNALNIVVERDTDGADARNEGAPISFEQAETLREMVRETRADEAAFLKFAGAATYAEIGANRYDALFQALQRKARK
jgi:hypothetical protein